MPFSYASGLWKDVNSMITKWEKENKYKDHVDPLWMIARALADLHGSPRQTLKEKFVLDKSMFTECTMSMGPSPFIFVGTEGCQATPLDVVRWQTQLTILSFEHFFPELGMPACIKCRSNKGVKGWLVQGASSLRDDRHTQRGHPEFTVQVRELPT
jgi:hypothetical protein